MLNKLTRRERLLRYFCASSSSFLDNDKAKYEKKKFSLMNQINLHRIKRITVFCKNDIIGSVGSPKWHTTLLTFWNGRLVAS